MSNIEEMRAKIMEVYPGVGWKDRVLRMPPNQVIAIYNNFLNRGMFSRKAKKRRREEEYHQLDIFEVFGKEIL